MPMNQDTDRTDIAGPGADSESLSVQQRRFWVLDQLERTDAPHNVPVGLDIRGRLDLTALEEAVRTVLGRHHVLRSHFVLENDEPRAVISSSGFLSLPVVSLTQMPETKRRKAATALAAKGLHQAFDLQAGPLFRATLYQLSNTEHLLALTLHRIVCDSVASLILTKEIAVSYDCIVRNTPLPPPGPQYADYVRSQGHYLRGSQYDGDLAFWKNKLDSAPAGVELPVDRPRALVPSFHGAEQFTVISGELLAALRMFSHTEQSSTFLALLSAFFVLLARYTAGQDIVIGTEVSGRNDPEMANVLGAVSNQLVLRADCSGNPSFRNMLRRTSQVWAEAQQHQAMPFGTLLDALHVRRDMGRNPLFQVSFSRGVTAESTLAAGLSWEPVRFDTETEILDLSVNVIERDQEIEVRFSYSTDLFDPATIARMIDHFRTLLQAAVQNPEQSVSLMPLLTPAERHQILVQWNDTTTAYPATECVHQLFEAQAERTPNTVACVFEKDQLTYRELNEQANQLAHYLKQRGIGSGQRVGILVERSLAMMVGLLGIQKSGAAYVPLDPYYPAERLKLVMDDAQVPVLLTQQALLPTMPEHAAEVICLDSDWPQIAQQSASNPQSAVKPEDIVYVIYTSGSTGRPKGVQVPHRAVVNLLSFMAQELHMGPGDVFPALASFAFDMCIPELYLALVTGGRTVVVRREMASNGEELAALLRESGATIVHATPTTWSLLLDAGFTAKGLKRAIGAEPLPRELCTRLLEADNSLYNFYGPTETTVWSTFHHFRAVVEPIVLGRPLANTQVYILDKNLQPVPAGVPGEIHIAGDGVTCGYLNLPELTADKFILNPFSPESNSACTKPVTWVTSCRTGASSFWDAWTLR